MKKTLLALGVLAASASATAADYSNGIHENDYMWMQFNLMYALDEKPRLDTAAYDGHDYLEMEFGGRSGIFDLYGYIDVFNITGDSRSDKAGSDKLFMKFNPRMSLDAATGYDLSFGPVQELYIASEMIFDGGASDGAQKWGLGSDVMVPWFGKMGLNVYGVYDMNDKDWNGFQISTNWFKPFYFFDNGSFISYQGYIDYQFGMDDEAETAASHGGAMYNGIYWHNERFAVGYGLKLYSDVYGVKDGSPVYNDDEEKIGNFESSGVSHYIAATYKF